jgi:HSP20 family protein
MWPSLNRWASFRDDLDTLLELPFLTGGQQAQLFTGWTPALDLYQNNDNVVAVVELPGMRKEDIEISLHDGMLTIGGERKSETGKNGESAARTERFMGKFRRSITLPTRVDANKVNATYKDGILTVTLPKAEEAKPKQIQINVS